MSTAKATKDVQAAFEQAKAMSEDSFRKGAAALTEASAFGKDNLDAWLASANAAKKGFDTLSNRAVAFQKQALQNHMAATRDLMTSKSVQELVERQTAYARTAFDALQAEFTTMTELMTGIAQEAASPISGRVNAVRKLVPGLER